MIAAAPSAPLPLAHRGEGLARWLSARSYALLRPVCATGLGVIGAMLVVVDPALFAAGIWGHDPMHEYLVVWHLLAWFAFAAIWIAARPARDHRGRQRVLRVFYALASALFAGFAVISWSLNGDLSTYAIFLLAMACVFAGQGRLRRALGLASAMVVSATILWMDTADSFRTGGTALNLLALAVVAGLLEAFVSRLNRALFMQRVRSDEAHRRAQQVLDRTLPASVSASLQQRLRAGAVRFDDLAVLFIDLVGFTRHCAQRSPEEVVALLDGLFSTFDRLAQAHGVEKIKTMGDAYLAVADRNLAGTLAMAQDCIHAMGPYRKLGLDIRCGVHAGPAVAGVVGLTRYLYDVWGDAVNLASRMESTGSAGRVQVSDLVAERMAGRFRFEYRGEQEIRGRGRMRTHWLVVPQAQHRPAPREAPGCRERPIRRSGANSWADAS